MNYSILILLLLISSKLSRTEEDNVYNYDELKCIVNTTTYNLDEARITFISHFNFHSYLATVSHDCWRCSYTNESFPSNSNVTRVFDTKFLQYVMVLNDSFNVIMSEKSLSLENQAEYIFEVSDVESSNGLKKVKDGIYYDDILVYSTIAILIFLYITWQLIVLSYNRVCHCAMKQTNVFSTVSGGSDSLTSELVEPIKIAKKERVKSIDAFRGLSLILMIFVNNGGGGYWYFQHATWNGITFADVVFPWFVFIMGMTNVISTRTMLGKGIRKRTAVLSAVKRFMILFAIGLVLSNQHCTCLSDIRILGVLQRLSLAYLVVAIVEVISQQREYVDVFVGKYRMWFRDVEDYWRGWIVIITCIVVHTCITFLLPVPGCPKGYLGPGGLHDNSTKELCTGGAAGYIDRLILGSNHLYQRPTFKKTYQATLPYDPEGLLGTLNVIVLCCLGAQMGRVLTFYVAYWSKFKRWILWALLLGLAGTSLCYFRQNGGLIPLNKNLWSLSFTLTMASTSILVFVTLYTLIDKGGVVTGAPFVYLGMNSLFIYVASELLDDYFPFKFQINGNSHLSLLLLHLWNVLLWVLISYAMYLKKIFVAL